MTLATYIFGETDTSVAEHLKRRGVLEAEVMVYPVRTREIVDNKGYRTSWVEYGVNVKELERTRGLSAFLPARIVDSFVAGLGVPKLMVHSQALSRAYSINDDLARSGIESKVIEVKPKEKSRVNMEWCGSPRDSVNPRL